MVDVSPAQLEILAWILRSGSGDVVLAPVRSEHSVDLVVPKGPRRRVEQGDVARLVDLLLVQHVQRKVYRVTELGREVARGGT